MVARRKEAYSTCRDSVTAIKTTHSANLQPVTPTFLFIWWRFGHKDTVFPRNIVLFQAEITQKT